MVPEKGCRILLVEDESAIADLYATVLRMHGHDITIAPDGVVALETADGHDFDLVLLDIRLPRLNGMAVLETLAARPRTQAWPVVMLTNFDDPALRRRALELGARDYLLKSRVVPRQLAEMIPGWATSCG